MTAVSIALALALASTDERAVAEAISAYDQGAFQQSKAQLLELLERPLSDELWQRAQLYLAASYYALNDTDSARSQLRALFKRLPSADLADPKFPPRFHRLAAEVKDELAAQAASEPPPPPPPPPVDRPVAEPPPTRPPPESAPVPPPVISVAAPARADPRAGALAFVPFGVGQFARGDTRTGAIFLVAEGLCFTASAIALARLEAMKVSGEPFRSGVFRKEDFPAARTAHDVYLATFYVGVAVAVAGIAEAIWVDSQLAGAKVTSNETARHERAALFRF